MISALNADCPAYVRRAYYAGRNERADDTFCVGYDVWADVFYNPEFPGSEGLAVLAVWIDCNGWLGWQTWTDRASYDAWVEANG